MSPLSILNQWHLETILLESTTKVLGTNGGGQLKEGAADREVERASGTCKILGPHSVPWPQLWRHLLPTSSFCVLGF